MKAYHVEQKRTETELTVESLRLPTMEELENHFSEVSLLNEQLPLCCFWDIDEETFEAGEEDGTWGSNPYDTGFVLIVPVADVAETVSVGETYLINGVPFTAISAHELLCATFTDYISEYNGIGTYEEFQDLTDPNRFLNDGSGRRGSEDDDEEEEDPIAMQDLSAFETVAFGPYEWLVLDQNEKGKLLLTKDAIAARPYNSKEEDCTWETCDLRTWLNGEFLNRFEEKERDQILRTLVRNPDHPNYGTPGGNDTEDKVFLLSIEEAEFYFKGDANRICLAGKEAQAEGEWFNNEEGACWWWLRSPGDYSYNAANVLTYGSVNGLGNDVYFSIYAVRPALWVNLES